MTATLVLPSTIDLEGISSANPTWLDTPKTMARAKMDNLTVPSRMPRTSLEWKRALVEVKQDYLSQRYRACSTRCCDLLAGAKTSRTANLAHLVYLHFYAASALETQVRSMHRGSPHRIGLLDRARDHYRRASVLAEAEGQAAVLLISSRSASPASPYSPAPSLSSSSGSASTRMSSPTPDSPDGSDTTAHSTPRKGQVEPHCVDIIMDQPQRPDSPTLGPSSRPECSTPEHGGVLATLKLAHQYGHDRVLVDEGESENPLERTRSLHRYADALAALHRQIMTVHLPASQDVAPARPPPSNDDMRAIELRTRIERLRAEGWRRRRFDAARYEALREAALADLMG